MKEAKYLLKLAKAIIGVSSEEAMRDWKGIADLDTSKGELVSALKKLVRDGDVFFEGNGWVLA